MKYLKLLVGASIILLASAFVVNKVIDWKVKDNYSVKFSFEKLVFGKDSMSKPIGTFKGLKASISFDEANPRNSKIKASIEAKTINTGDPSRDASARYPDVLDADKFPLITFESTAITKAGNLYEATGKLTLKNITKEIRLPFTFENQTFSGGFTIETKDFNFTHPHVPKEITIFLTIPVTQ